MLITTGQTDSRFGYIMSELNILPRIFLVMVITNGKRNPMSFTLITTGWLHN